MPRLRPRREEDGSLGRSILRTREIPRRPHGRRGIKVFCPAFLQKSGRGQGAEPWPRAAASGKPHRQRSAGGGKGGTLAGGPPFAGGLAARSLTHRHNAGGEQTLSGREFMQLAYTFAEYIYLSLPVPPHFFGLSQRNGVEPQRKALLGGGAPVRFRDPPASPTRVGGATRPLRCPLRGLISSLAATARGLGWQRSGTVKVLCPALL